MGKEYRLDKKQVERYSRQLLISDFGVSGQKNLIDGAVLIVGCGGLGSPCGLYLASSGVGKIGLVDFDTVDTSNLHRQIIHSTETIGATKTSSAAQSIKKLNPLVKVEEYNLILDAKNAMEIIQCYDIVVDASDNVITRYILGDVCVLLKKPLVSGSALRWEGHLTTFLPNKLCYRCLYPIPTPPSAVTNCETGGIIPPVVGIIGCMQAMEVIKLLIGSEPAYYRKLALYNAQDGTLRIVKLREKRDDCFACNGNINPLTIDYAKFCGGGGVCDKAQSLNLLNPKDRITPQEYYNEKDKYLTLIDVRPAEQYEICSLSNSINVTLDKLDCLNIPFDSPILTVCRRGNQSQKAVLKLKQLGYTNVKDIIGGITAYGKEVDPTFPIY